MNEKIYYSAEDIAKRLGASMVNHTKSLEKWIRTWKASGVTIAGKIPVVSMNQSSTGYISICLQILDLSRRC